MNETSWKFEIGDIVAHKAADFSVVRAVSAEIEKQFRASWLWRNIVRYMVLERVIQECHGGIRKFYSCRLVNCNGSIADRNINFSEFELVPFKPAVAELKEINVP